MNRQPLNPNAQGWASQNDRQFFLRHPGRQYRCRRPLPGESDGDRGQVILVIRITEDMRIRAAVDGMTDLVGASDEELADVVNDLVGPR
ncbi:MAG: hypothetical protein R3E46_04275 [Sedimenticolaceae bacterium]